MSGFNIIEYDCWDWMNDVGFYHDSLSDTWLLLMDNIMIVHSMTTVVLKYDNNTGTCKIYGYVVKIVYVV